MSPWPTGDHCAAWIGLAPKNEVSGGKILKKRTRKVVSRLATALRMAATTLRLSQSYLGAQFRRFRGKLGAPNAITAWLPRAIETALEFKMSSGGGAAGDFHQSAGVGRHGDPGTAQPLGFEYCGIGRMNRGHDVAARL